MPNLFLERTTGTVGIPDGHCTGTVRALYGHCAGTVENPGNDRGHAVNVAVKFNKNKNTLWERVEFGISRPSPEQGSPYFWWGQRLPSGSNLPVSEQPAGVSCTSWMPNTSRVRRGPRV